MLEIRVVHSDEEAVHEVQAVGEGRVDFPDHEGDKVLGGAELVLDVGLTLREGHAHEEADEVHGDD